MNLLKYKKLKKVILLILILLLAIPFLVYFYNQYSFDNHQKTYKANYLKNNPNMLPKFESTSLPFDHVYDRKGKSMPFLDTKIIYPYDDDRPAIMQTGGAGQGNAVLLYENGKFTDISEELNLKGFVDVAAYSIAYDDIDGDQIKEIIIGYENAVYAYKRKQDSFAYEAPVKITDIPDAAIPVDIALSDTNNSGNLDVYICTFVDKTNFTSATYHDNTNKRQNLFMVNNGDGTFSEKSKEVGLHLIQNSYLAKFVDLNNNGREDLVLALNTDLGRIYENLGNGKFKEHLLPIEYGFWMGLSVEKINDKTDKYSILMSNIGKSFPVTIVRGDLKKGEIFEPSYALLEQVDGFKFKNVTSEKNLNSNVFGWGLALADLNNNGRKDGVLTENYIQFPAGIHSSFPSKGKLFLQDVDGKFAPFQEETGLVNPYFGYRVLTYDFNSNGYKDVVIGNVNGPIKLFLNKGVQ